MEKLPGDYIAGFVDGEGCFALKFRQDIRHKRKGVPIYYYWGIEFAIVLREDDKFILESIQQTLTCGFLSHSHGTTRYSVSRLEDLRHKVVPFFDKYPLRAKKAHDYKLWKEALDILLRNQQKESDRTGKRGFVAIQWKPGDIARLKEIREKMRIYKAKLKNDWKWLSKAVD